MPDIFKLHLNSGFPMPTNDVILCRVIFAMILGVIVAAIYRATLGRHRDDTHTLPTTLVLLCLLVSLVTVTIGDNIARAFGLVGALSIVRFRTVVDDTRDTAFVIFAVVIGMAIGAGYAVLAIVGIPAVATVVGFAALNDRVRGGDGAPATLTLRLAMGVEPQPLLNSVCRPYLSKTTLQCASTAKQATALELVYKVRLKPNASPFALVAELNRIEGVQNVEIRRM